MQYTQMRIIEVTSKTDLLTSTQWRSQLIIDENNKPVHSFCITYVPTSFNNTRHEIVLLPLSAGAPRSITLRLHPSLDVNRFPRAFAAVVPDFISTVFSSLSRSSRTNASGSCSDPHSSCMDVVSTLPYSAQ
jgi:hypothetical protein